MPITAAAAGTATSSSSGYKVAAATGRRTSSTSNTTKTTATTTTTTSSTSTPSMRKVLDHFGCHCQEDITITEVIPPLESHHVVLGRYLGSKTKPLNEATRIYRDLRKTTKRTKHFASEEIADLKQTLTNRLRAELNLPMLPDVVFVVDIHKADDSNKLEPFLSELKKDNNKEEAEEAEDKEEEMDDGQAEVGEDDGQTTTEKTKKKGTTRRCLVQKQVPTSSNNNGVEGTSTTAMIIFMEDEEDDHFLKADLDSKKRPGARHVTPASATSSSAAITVTSAMTVASDCTSVTTNASACKKRKLVEEAEKKQQQQTRNLVSPLQSMDSSSSYNNNSKSTTSAGTALNATTASMMATTTTPSVISCSTARTMKTDTSSLTDDRTTATPTSSIINNNNKKVGTTTTPSEAAPATGRFQLQVRQSSSSTTTNTTNGGDDEGTTLNELEEQAHQICEDWIRQEDTPTNHNGGSGSGLEAMLRKASLVQSFQSYCSHYKRRLQHNPFLNSPIPALRCMNEQQFATIINTLGNSMMDWYNKYPTTCLEGEANSWTGGVVAGLQKQQQSYDDDDYYNNVIMSDADHDHPQYHYYSDVVGMEQGSIGTYSSLELEFLPSLTFAGGDHQHNDDDGVSDIVQCFEEFSMGSSTNRTIHSRVVGVRKQQQHQRGGAGQHQKQPSANHLIRNEWSPVVRDHNCNNHQAEDAATAAVGAVAGAAAAKQLPPRWTSKSRQLFQKRQQGHQFLQKQLRRFRNKKSSSSSRPSSSSASLRSSSKKKKTKTAGSKTATAMAAATTATAGAVSAVGGGGGYCTNNPTGGSHATNNCQPTVRVSTKEELSLLYRRLRHNDPTLKEAIVDFDIAQKEAKELIRVLGLSFYDWDMHRRTTTTNCSSSSSENDDEVVSGDDDNNNNNEFIEEQQGDHEVDGDTRSRRSNKNAFIVLKRSESSDWEDSATR